MFIQLFGLFPNSFCVLFIPACVGLGTPIFFSSDISAEWGMSPIVLGGLCDLCAVWGGVGRLAFTGGNVSLGTAFE